MYVPSNVASDDLIAAIKGVSGKRQTRCRVHLLDKYETLVKDLSEYFLSGEVTVDIDRTVDRTAQVEFANPSNYFTVDPDILGEIWYDSRFKLLYEINVNGVWATVPLGVFLMDSPAVTTGGRATYNFVGKTYLIDNALGYILNFDATLALEEAIRRILCRIDHQGDCNVAHTRNPNFTWHGGGWASGDAAGAYGGHYSYSKTNGDYVEWTMTGKQVTWVAARQPNCGIVNVYIDGVLDATVDLYNAAYLYRQHVYSKVFPYGGTHTIRVEVTNTKNASASDYYCVVDALQASTIFTDDDLLFESSGTTLGQPTTVMHDASMVEVIRALARSHNMIFFENGDGKFCLRAYPVFETLPVAWSYEVGKDSIMLSTSMVTRPPRYNHAVIAYGGSDTVPLFEEYKAEDDVPGTLFATTGALGDRVLVVRDSNVTTSILAQLLAKRTLEDQLMIAQEISVTAVPNPFHEPYDKIYISEQEHTMVSTYYSLRAFNVPLNKGTTQSFTVARQRNI